MKADLFFLAGDRFRGRLTATPENDLASEFIASRFERLGLKRIGDGGSYYHRFNLTTASLGPSNSLSYFSERGTDIQLSPGQDFTPLTFCPSGVRSAQSKGLTLAGFGIHAPDKSHDDYQDLTPSGDIVVVFEHEPGENDPKSPFDGVVMSEAATPWRKAPTAQEHRASGILFVSDVQNHPGPENFEATARSEWPEKPPRILRYTLQDWVERVDIPAARISTALAQVLLHKKKRSLEDLAMRRKSRR